MDNPAPPSSDSGQSKLFEKMKRIFGNRGDYSSAMLKTAEDLLNQREPTLGQSLAAIYCIRQAVVELFIDRGNTSSSLGDAAKRVMDIKRKFNDQTSPTTRELQTLYDVIERQEEIRTRHSIHKRRFESFVKSMTGQVPLGGNNSPWDEYHDMIAELNHLAHDLPAEGRDYVAIARTQHKRAINTLARLLLASERRDEIIRLAETPEPRDEDAKRLKEYLVSPNDFAWFAKNIKSSAWFDVMGPDLLDPPTDTRAWIVPYIAYHLKNEHADALACLVEDHWDDWARNNAGIDGLAPVTRLLGERGLPLLVKLLRKNPTSNHVYSHGLLAYSNTDAANPLIADLADLLLDSGSALARRGNNNEILAKLVEGMDLSSSKKRIMILIYKRSREQSGLRNNFLGKIIDIHRKTSYGNALTGSLCDALKKGRELENPTSRLVEWLAPLPPGMKIRIEAWLYLEADDIDCFHLMQFIVEGCRNRAPTRDDAALLDRLVRDCGMKTGAKVLAEAVGKAPELGDLENIRQIEGRFRDWQRVRWAVEIGNRTELPGWEGIIGEWSNQGQDRPFVEYPTYVRPTSAFKSEEFDSADPYDLAARIESWRPAASQGILDQPSANGISHNLEDAVKRNPDKWLEDPVRMIKTLKHPTYVAGYFQGAAHASGSIGTRADRLILAIRHARMHPEPAVQLDSSPLEYDSGWMNADVAGIDLIRSLSENNVKMSDVSLADAWNVVCQAAAIPELDLVKPVHVEPQQDAHPRDPMNDAINEPRTNAMSVMLYLVHYAKRGGRDVPERVPKMLTDALQLLGRDGAMYRAIIASHVGILHSCLPEWFEKNESLLFGNAAPGNLAQLALDMHIQWESPDGSVLKKHMDKVLDAVRRDVENAMDCLMIGMLVRIDGYEPKVLAQCLADMGPKYVSLAGECTARSLDGESDADPIQRGVDLWTGVLETPCGSDAFAGYSWWASVSALDQDKWERLTLATLDKGKMDWANVVTQRINTADTITETGLRILEKIIQSGLDPLEEIQAAEYISEVLHKSKDDAGIQTTWEDLRDAMIQKGHEV